MNKVTIHINSQLHHFSQLLAGFQFLSDHNQILLKYKLDPGKYPGDIFRVQIDGLQVFFDLADTSKIRKNIYDEADYYVKRMLLRSDYGKYNKLIPYGLYYPVYYRNFPLKFLFLKDLTYLKYSMKYWESASALLKVKDGIAVNEMKKVESDPAEGECIIFRARLWDPGNNNTPWKKEERIVLNEQRIEINRRLKAQFDKKFTGGILRNEYSEKICPDLLLPAEEYHRKKYLKLLKTASIGVVNQGLEGSIGAKMAEYVANGLAILTTPIDQYENPSFEEGKNYLTYTSTQECVSLVRELTQNRNLRKQLQENNRNYYQEKLHPGRKIAGILDHLNKRMLKNTIS